MTASRWWQQIHPAGTCIDCRVEVERFGRGCSRCPGCGAVTPDRLYDAEVLG